MSTNKEDRSFKTLINRETTDSQNKYYFNEFGADTINVHADDLWAETVPYNNPATGILTGVVEERVLFILTEDITVPNSQSWKAGIKDWISPKYGASYVAHLFDSANNEIFPTDALDWFFDYQTGILTFSGVLARPTPLKITGYRYIGIKGINGAAQDIVTQTPMTFPIDYNDGSAVDPPVGVVWTTQSQIDDFLSSEGATNFKHIMACWDACPIIIDHAVTFDCAAGVHRPRPTDNGYYGSFYFEGKICTRVGVNFDVFVRIKGAEPSTYNQAIGTQTITATGGQGSDPYFDFSGTPFPADNSLRGLFLVLDTGQVTIINRNTTSRLYVNNNVSGSPVSGFVGRPSTILRGSLDDSTPVSRGVLGIDFSVSGTLGSLFYVSNVQLDTFTTDWANTIHFMSGYLWLENVLDDQAWVRDTFSMHPSSVLRSLWDYGLGGLLYINKFSIRGTRLALISPSDTTQYGIHIATASNFNSVYSSYIGGASYGASWSSACELVIDKVVIDQVAIGIVLEVPNSSMRFHGYGDGILNTIRNCTQAGLHVVAEQNFLYDTDNHYLNFENVTGACVKLATANSFMNATAGNVRFLNGPQGGNLDVGIELEEPLSKAILTSYVTCNGAAGDVRFGDTVLTYAEILADGPFIDDKFRYLEKVT